MKITDNILNKYDISQIKISLFTSISDVNPSEITLDNLHQLIVSGHYKKLMECIRREEDKKKRSTMKQKLPAVTLSGVFVGGHKANQIKQPSGLMQIDFDDVDVKKVKQTLNDDPHTLLSFVSPSGTGIKGVVRYTGEHLRAFNALQKYYKTRYDLDIDKSCKDICRLCFLSYDPQATLNKDAQVFRYIDTGDTGTPAPPVPSKTVQKHNVYALSAENSQKRIEWICDHLGSVDMTESYDDWFKCALALASEFGERGRAYFQTISRNHTGYDAADCDRKFNDAMKAQPSTVSIAYLFARANDYGLKPDNNNESKIATAKNTFVGTEQKKVYINPATGNEYTDAETKELHNFYTFKMKNGKVEGIKLKKKKVVNVLRKLGYSILFKDAKNYLFVKVDDNCVEEISEEVFPSIFQYYILELPPYTRFLEGGGDNEPPTQIVITPQMLDDAYVESIENQFNKKQLMLLKPQKNYTMFEDTKTTKYFFYQNGIAEVTKDGIAFKSYSVLKDASMYIWRNQLLPRNYTPADEQRSVFERFVMFLASVRKQDASGKYIVDDEATTKRCEALWSIIGYCLHSFFDTKLFAINFTDSRMDEDGEANGRSGKTLLVRGMGMMLNANRNCSVYVELPGRNFDFRDAHRYEACNLDTKIVHINDVPRRFDIERLFNDITDGLQAKKMYGSKFNILTKMIVSSNQTLYVNGDSSRDRIVHFEVSDYFSIAHTPEQEFGHWLFSDWDAAEWARFDTFMQRCCLYYLANGIQKAKSINLEKRMVRDHTSIDFVSWMDYQFEKYDEDGTQRFDRFMFCKDEDEVKTNRIDKKELYKRFVDENADYSAKGFSQRKLTNWIKLYIKNIYKGAKVGEKRSNGTDYIWFYYPKK